MDNHIHNWKPTGINRVMCGGCNTVSDISTMLKNVAEEAAKEARLKLLSAQLYARELKKAAHDKYYQEVISESRNPIAKVVDSQELLL